MSLEKETVREFRKVGITADFERFVKSWAGNITMKISKTHYTLDVNGEKETIVYKMIAEKDNCFTVEAQGRTTESCIIDGLLYVPYLEPGFEGASVVYKKQ